MRKVIQYATAIKQPDSSYKFRVKDKQMFKDQFFEFLARGKDKIPLEIEYRLQFKEKTLPQLRYVKGPFLNHLLKAFREAGYDLRTTDEAEFEIKRLFYFRSYTDPLTGEIIKKPLSFADISKEDMMDFITQVRDFAHQNLDYIIPSPEDWAKMEEIEL